jgi:serine/threonine protein kinase
MTIYIFFMRIKHIFFGLSVGICLLQIPKNILLDMSIENNAIDSLSPQAVADPFGTLDNFDTLTTEINRGHFSTVYLGRNRINGIHVAVKKVELSKMTDAKAIEDCKGEVLLLQQLDHPNIIKYISHFVDNNDLYIVLELASAGDLTKMITSFIRDKKLIPEKWIWILFSQICSGLEHMHLKRIMHRDVKPANVFVSSKGIVKLGDLGLSRFFGSETTSTDTIVGTPYYMSPERIREQAHRYDFQSDIWSLACILYELTVLRSPFYGKNMDLVLLRNKIEALDYPSLPKNLYSTELHLLVAKCLVIDPKQRPGISEVCCIAELMKTRFLAQAVNSTPTLTSPSNTDSDCGISTPFNNG